MKIIKKIAYLSLVLSAAVFTSCDEGGEPDKIMTATGHMAGDWHIQGFLPDGTPEDTYHVWSTYNASTNDNNMWLDDHGSYFELKSKVQADVTGMTFSGPANAPELITEGTVTITNGKIWPNAAHSFGGHVVDSISFNAEFDWDPGTIYRFGGHKRTGFLEDEL